MRENIYPELDDHPMEMVNGLVVPAFLSNQHFQNDYQHKLEMLALSAGSKNAFLFELQKNAFTPFGEATHFETLNFKSISQSLSKHTSRLKTLELEHEAQTLRFVFMLIVDEQKVPLALVGACLNSMHEANSRRESDGCRLPHSKRKLLNLVMLQFQEQMRALQKEQVMQVIHSQHLQLSALNQDYICIKDNAHRLVYANPALSSTFPKNVQDKFLGSTSAQYYSPDAIAQITNSDITALQMGFFKGIEQITLANGIEKILHTNKKSFVGVDGKKYLMSVSRDITEKEILINDLKRSNADLDNFAYVASHDLKAPLNAIKRLVSWVKEDCEEVLPGESKEDLAIVLNRVERMEKLLNDLLSYSRIGKEYQAATQINLRDFTVELLSLIDLPMGFVMNCDNVNVTVPLIPFNVVMLNLVSNAIKHHDSGNAKIEIKAKRNDKGCIISILDNGPGIETKNRERVFKLFETLKPRDQVEGSGMGLSVVKKIVEHYGGTVKVDANLPRGSKFIVSWPTTNIARTVLDNLND